MTRPLDRRTFLQTTLLAVAAGARGGADAQRGLTPQRILFIGNSLTYANDLPAMIAALVTASGGAMTSRMIAFPDFGLEEHWNDGRARIVRCDVAALRG